jgi:hypothetical protein
MKLKTLQRRLARLGDQDAKLLLAWMEAHTSSESMAQHVAESAAIYGERSSGAHLDKLQAEIAVLDPQSHRDLLDWLYLHRTTESASLLQAIDAGLRDLRERKFEIMSRAVLAAKVRSWAGAWS